MKMCDLSCARYAPRVDALGSLEIDTTASSDTERQELLDRVQHRLVFAEQHRFLAVSIDVADVKALLIAAGGAT